MLRIGYESKPTPVVEPLPAAGLIAREDSILVLGSLNAKPQDRRLERAEVRPVQLVSERGFEPVPFFDDWGELGVSSLAWDRKHPDILFVATDRELFRLDIERRDVRQLSFPNARDIHELTLVDGTLWVANTGRDEAVAIDTSSGAIRRRVGLAKYRSGVSVTEGATNGGGGERQPDDTGGGDAGRHEVERVDRFHCNQVFDGFDQKLYALVHHVTGWQLVRKIAEKVIKSHGNGGVICLDTGDATSLNLKGPHTVRRVNGHYWLFDSGAAVVRTYDPDWSPRGSLPGSGWGRGADLSSDGSLFYAGVSETRRRYLNLPGARHNPNMIEVYSTDTRARVGELVVATWLEQINNIYVIPADVGRRLLEL